MTLLGTPGEHTAIRVLGASCFCREMKVRLKSGPGWGRLFLDLGTACLGQVHNCHLVWFQMLVDR